MPVKHERRLQVFRTMTGRGALDVADRYRQGFAKQGIEIERDLVNYLDKTDAIMTNPRYTRRGAKEEAALLAKAQDVELAKALEKIDAKLGLEIDTRKAAALRAPKRDHDPTLGYLKQRDMVDYFNSVKDPLQQRVVLDTAVREKDLELLDALATAPRYRRQFDMAQVNAAREQVATVVDPELDQLVALRDSHARAYNSARTVVQETLEQVRQLEDMTTPQMTGGVR